MAASAGTNSLVQVSTTAGGGSGFNTVADINSASMNHSGNTIDVGAFGITYMQRILGIKDATYQLSGFFNMTDTTGQLALRNAWRDGSEIWVAFLPDGSTGFKQQVRVIQIDVNSSVDGVVEISFQLEGTGAVAAM